MNSLPEELVARRIGRMAELTRLFSETLEGETRRRAHLRSVRRSAIVDMSPTAVDARLRRVAALRRLCLSLGTATR